MRFLNIGISNLDKDKWVAPTNAKYGNKPIGGLWGSPLAIRGKFASPWHEWCYYEMPHWILEDCVTFELKEDTRIYEIDCLEDLEILVSNYKIPTTPETEIITRLESLLDFEKIARDYDAIYLTDRGEASTRFSVPSLYGWDCESILILNFDCITNFKNEKLTVIVDGLECEDN